MSGSILGIAEKHCANWCDGICAGIDFKADGSLFRFRQEGCACVLKDKKRCSYFEKVVLPIGKNPEWQKLRPGLARVFEQGADRYHRLHSPGLSQSRHYCGICGVQIGPRMRFCVACRDTQSPKA